MTFYNFKNGSSGTKTLTIYGLIGRWMDVDEREFSDRMKEVGDSDLEIYVNSDGGSVFTALTIYNMLSRHKGSITFYIDGIAASAATLITSVPGAKVIAPVGSMMMIHSPMTDPMRALNAEEFRELADRLDKVGGSIAGVYKLKTGLDDAKITDIMSDDTYLTALEAVDLGFADEVGQQMDVAACLTRDKMTVNGLDLDPTRHAKMPETWLSQASADNPSRSAGNNTEEPKERKPMNLEQLKAEHQELYNAVLAEGKQLGVNEGAENERARIKAIEEMAMTGHEDLVNKAKYEDVMSAEGLAVQLITAERKRKQDFLANRQNDANDIGDLGDQNLDPEASRKKGEGSKADDAQREEIRAAARSVSRPRRSSMFNRKEA